LKTSKFLGALDQMITRDYFQSLVTKLLSGKKSAEHYFFSLSGEESQFVRINASQVRQIGTVSDSQLRVTLLLESADGELRDASRTCTLSGLSWQDQETLTSAVKILRNEVPSLPPNPYAEKPENFGESFSETKGSLLSFDHAIKELLPASVSQLDMAGIYCSGPIIRAMANSAGQMLWFSTEIFSFDYSLYTKSQRALKAGFSGKQWDSSKFVKAIEKASEQLPILEKTPKKLERGSYRTYLAPDCIADLLGMISYGAFGEASIRQSESPLRLLRSGERKLSPLMNVAEDFRGGEVPQFNSVGRIAADHTPLIEKGELRNTMISSRSAKEFNLQANGAEMGEVLRSPVMSGGALDEDQILKSLDTGLYLSNLHYLNWSDQVGGRITGMTRYACFWVEKGKIVAPIENMRWDDSIFSLFGSELEALTKSVSYSPSTLTYTNRSLGGMHTPGAIVKKMTFTI
jgi:predicted Zn-dependent protease